MFTNYVFSTRMIKADLPLFKSLAAYMLDQTGLTNSQKIEVFARLCGYKTYAALTAALERADEKHGILLNEENPVVEGLISELSPQRKKVIAKISDTKISKLMEAAKRELLHPVFGMIGVLEDINKEKLFSIAENILPQRGDTHDEFEVYFSGALVNDALRAINAEPISESRLFRFSIHLTDNAIAQFIDSEEVDSFLPSGRHPLVFYSEDEYHRITMGGSLSPTSIPVIRDIDQTLYEIDDADPAKSNPFYNSVIFGCINGSELQDPDMAAKWVQESLTEALLLVMSYNRELALFTAVI